MPGDGGTHHGRRCRPRPHPHRVRAPRRRDGQRCGRPGRRDPRRDPRRAGAGQGTRPPARHRACPHRGDLRAVAEPGHPALPRARAGVRRVPVAAHRSRRPGGLQARAGRERARASQPGQARAAPPHRGAAGRALPDHGPRRGLERPGRLAPLPFPSRRACRRVSRRPPARRGPDRPRRLRGRVRGALAVRGTDRRAARDAHADRVPRSTCPTTSASITCTSSPRGSSGRSRPARSSRPAPTASMHSPTRSPRRPTRSSPPGRRSISTAAWACSRACSRPVGGRSPRSRPTAAQCRTRAPTWPASTSPHCAPTCSTGSPASATSSSPIRAAPGWSAGGSRSSRRPGPGASSSSAATPQASAATRRCSARPATHSRTRRPWTCSRTPRTWRSSSVFDK